MYTDWLLVRRLAWELDRRLAGGRVRDVGELEDGRLGIVVWKNGRECLLCIDAFAPTPIATIEDAELPIGSERGFVRAVGTALKGSVLLSVRSRLFDRLLRFDFGTRSRFGVEDGNALVCELVPRFGNIILLKGETVVAAAKEFPPSQNAVRSVEAGDIYDPPPLRTLHATPMIDEHTAARLAEQPSQDDLYVYRRQGALVQAHLVPLERFADCDLTRSPSLLDLLDESRRGNVRRQESNRAEKRRRELLRTLETRERKALAEIAKADARLESVAGREQLREQGDAIYATLHDLPQGERDAAKQHAAELFAQYRKAGAARTHVERRRGELETALADIEALRWELERVPDAQLDDVTQAIAGPPRSGKRSAPPPRKRKPLTFRTARGSRIYVGRTPVENADLTFRLARPDDLWFHVQNQPGAHVIVQRDDKSPVPPEDILTAASLAALHSKAKAAPKVTVDYTHRKHVRKRPAAAPGLVFYTHPKSVIVAPSAPSEMKESPQ